jgi:hypothetical protein
MEIGGETLKPAHGFRIPIGTHRDVMDTIADIDACRLGMDHLQSGVLGSQPSSQLLSLLLVES